jgi:hypothetical protein
MLRAAANVAVPLIVNGPPASVIGPPLFRLATVWLAVARVPTLMAVVTLLAMHTLSVAIGTAPRLQFPAVVHWLSPAVPVQWLVPLPQVTCGRAFLCCCAVCAALDDRETTARCA